MKTLFFIISLSLVSFTLFHSRGDCVDWLYAESNDDYTLYYDSSSIKIDKQKLFVEVWTKRVYTQKGKEDFLKDQNFLKRLKYNDLEYLLSLVLLDYKTWKWSITEIKYCSKAGDILFYDKRSPEWMDIKPLSAISRLMDTLRNTYKIYIDSP